MKRLLSACLLAISCSMLLACGPGDGWQEIHSDGSSFELPEPVGNPARSGYKVFESSFNNGKSKIQVGLYGKLASPTNPNATDAELFREQQEALVSGIQDNLRSAGYDPQLQFDGDLPVKDGLGQQVRILAGQQFVVTQAYITPRGFFFVKIDNADQNHPVVKRFMSSFEP